MRDPTHATIRLIVAFVVVGALAAAGVAALRERDYRAHSFVIRVPPSYGGDRGLAFAHSDPVLERTLTLSGSERSVAWLRERTSMQLTGRGDFALDVRAPNEEEAIDLATNYARAVKRSLVLQRGLPTQGRRALDAEAELGPAGWALLGGAAGLWLGAAVAIVRSGLRSGPRRASAPSPPATGPTRG
jgi:hypothetical protein